MNIHDFNSFYLVGGTALALQIGHRVSYDLDLFTNLPVANEEILNFLKHLRPFSILSQSKNIISLNIRNQKVGWSLIKKTISLTIKEIAI